LHDFRSIRIKHAVVVRLPVLAEDFFQLRIDRKAGGFETILDHAETAIRHDRAAERFVGLQADNHLISTIDVAGPMRGDRRGYRRVDVKYALLRFFDEIWFQRIEGRLCAVRYAGKEGFVAIIASGIADNEVSHIDLVLPAPRGETLPRNFSIAHDIPLCLYRKTDG
jgi:hypothetical protein